MSHKNEGTKYSISYLRTKSELWEQKLFQIKNLAFLILRS